MTLSFYGEKNIISVHSLFFIIYLFFFYVSEKTKYLRLWTLARDIFSIPHWNAEPEFSFSINKRVLEIHGSSTKQEAIPALQRVKDFIIKSGAVNNVVIGLDLLSSCGDASKRYKSLSAEQERQVQVNKKRCKSRKKEQWDAEQNIE